MSVSQACPNRLLAKSRFVTNWRWWALILIIILASFSSTAGQDKDFLDLENGALMLSATTQHGGKWNGPALLDGTNATGWSSARGYPYPNDFLIELPHQCLLTSFVVDNTDAEESNFPGSSARHFALYRSTTSAEEVVDLILSGEAEEGKRNVFTFEKPIEARWLKLAVLSNWGNDSYTQLMEIEAYGESLGAVPQTKSIHGIYSTNYGLMRLEQRGSYVVGCYEADNGLLSGKTDGRILKFHWWEDGPTSGTASMVLSTDGNHLNGLWYERGRVKGSWYGRRAAEGREPKCEVPVLDALVKSIYEAKLTPPMEESGQEKAQEEIFPERSIEKEAGLTILPEIYFATDSAEITPRSEKRLKQGLAAIQAQPNQKIIIRGHTDSTHTQEYNLELSLRRALSVVEWLVEHGADGNRMETKAFGESRPVANNKTEEGRALNRRVEILLQ